MQFPSSEWFEALITEVNNDEVKFRRLGWCDSDVRVDVREGATTRSFVIAFREYGCAGVSEVESGASPAVDFALAADSEVWREMLENITEHGQADLEHTLNYLQLPGIVELVAEDQGQADIFYRFNQTFQEFFNASAAVPTEFSVPVA